MKTIAATLAALAALLAPACAGAQPEGCAPDAVGCTRTDLNFRWRQGLPVEFDFDTGWVPGGAPVQLRVRAALVGNTEVSAAGQLVASWYEPLRLRAVGTRGAGSLAVDYGVQFSARVRLALPVEGRTVSWEGAIPYVPQIDFRAMASAPFDPWAWEGTTVMGRTSRVRIAEVPLTDAIVRIPGISGGFAFDAAGELQASYRSTAMRFGADAEPLTGTATETLARFTAGPSVEYHPQLEGSLEYTGALRVYPSLYVSLAGRRWMLDLIDLPIAVGPFPRAVRFDPVTARLELPDLHATDDSVDFGDVDLGRVSERTVEIQNRGALEGRIVAVEVEAPFTVVGGARTLPARSRGSFLVSFAPVRPGPVEATVLLSTNDPDTPRLRVAVRGNGVGVAPIEPSPSEDAAAPWDAADDAPTTPSFGATQDGGCGCRSAPAHAPRATVPAWMLVVLLGAPRRRRRGDQSSMGSKSAFVAPQSGQTQWAGRSSKAVPGATPLAGSPSAGS